MDLFQAFAMETEGEFITGKQKQELDAYIDIIKRLGGIDKVSLTNFTESEINYIKNHLAID